MTVKTIEGLMEKELVLGIDYGGKYTGIAVIDRRNNSVLYAKTIKMRDDITDILEGRREQRGIRRTAQTKKKRLWELKNYLKSIGMDESTETFKAVYSLAHKRGYDYAEPPEDKTPEELKEMDAKERKQWEKEKGEWEETLRNSRHRSEVLRDVREAMTKGGAGEEQIKRVEEIFNKQYRPKRYDNRILMKCKVCGKNTPKRINVRELLLENIIRFLPLQDADKEALKGVILEGQQERINEVFSEYRKGYKLKLNQKDWPGKNLLDIARNKLPGRLPFCKEHFIENEKYTALEKKTFRLAPSLKAKIANVVDVIKKEVLPDFKFSNVVMEANNFDIAAKSEGKKRKAKDEYGKGHREGKETLLEALIKETNGRCIYCGKPITLSNANKDHIYPRSAGGISIFANFIACCRECNGKKRDRTPLESGILPDPKTVASIKNDFKKKVLEDARTINELDFNKYMSHASIGWRHLRDELRRIAGDSDLPVERQSGIITAFFRKRWWDGLKKERGNTGHHALDAVILASRRGYTDDGLADMTLKPIYMDGSEFDPAKHIPETKGFKRDKSNRGAALHDRNPLSIKNNTITRRWVVTEIERGKEDTVISEEYRRKLKEAFEHFDTKKEKCLNDEQAKEAGFYFGEKCISLKCRAKGLGAEQIVKIRNNAFKSNVHNVGVAVFLDEKGKRKACVLRNPRLLRYFIEPQPEIKSKPLFTLKRGDLVTVEGEDDTVYKIKKLGKSPVLEKAVGSDGKTRNVTALRLKKIKPTV